MEVLRDMAVWMSESLRPHLLPVSTAIMATLLALYGQSVHKAVRRQVQSLPFLVRVAIFVGVCAFGYGALTVLLAVLLKRLLTVFPDEYLAPTILLFFLVIGILAERKRQI